MASQSFIARAESSLKSGRRSNFEQVNLEAFLANFDFAVSLIEFTL